MHRNAVEGGPLKTRTYLKHVSVDGMGGEKLSAPLRHTSGCEPKTSNTDSGVLESFKGALLKDILFHIPTASRQAASTTFHALNSIKLCY